MDSRARPGHRRSLAGLGTYVGDGSLDPFADALVFRGRRSLRGDRRELFEIVDLFQAGQGRAGDDADRTFHEQLYASLGNQLLSQLLRVFWDVYHDLSHELESAEQDPDGIVAGHRAIYDGLAARDAVATAAAMSRHFSGIRARLQT